MNKVAIIGGGISGLSTAYYISKINKSVLIRLFEGNNIGGLIQTQQKSGFLIENGPSYFSTDFSSLNLLNLIHETGIFESLIHSKVPTSDLQIWSESKLQKFLPSPPFRLFKALTRFPVYRRALIKHWLNTEKKIKNPIDEIDISVKEFMINQTNFASKEDQDYIINTVLDALIQGTYAGDISKL